MPLELTDALAALVLICGPLLVIEAADAVRAHRDRRRAEQ